MKLSKAQIEHYDRDGYLLFPDLLSQAEVDALLCEVERVAKIESDGIFREGGDGQAKSMFRLHEPDAATYSPHFRAASRTPRVLGVAQQILRDDALYMHHCKVNMKAAIEGTAWAWHQDFGAWHLDGIAEPQMTTIAIMLHDTTELSGCLYFLPGSHRIDRIEPYWDDKTAYKFWAVPPGELPELMKRFPEPVAITGRAGSAALFDCNLLHSSGHNLSHRDRWQAYFCFNRVANHPHDVVKPRPDYVRSTNWEPMTLVDDDAILNVSAAA